MKYSVIIPLYNKESYIERTLRSVEDQTFGDYELIVVDDGSTDRSYDVAKQEMGSENPNRRIVRQKNSGVAVARNVGVSLAKGEYICFLDSDDWWEPTFLEEIDNLIKNYPDAGMYGTSFYLVKNGKQRIAPIGLDKGFEKGYINYCQVYAKTLCMPITSSSVAIRKDVFEEAGGFRTHISLGEDFDLWIRLALKYPVAIVNKPLANYFQDLPVHQRATRNLHAPSSHMLWNLDYLAEEEASNGDLKLLLDRLRGSGLYKYYISKRYHQEATVQLSKIDWKNVSQETYKKYHSPLFFQRVRSRLLTVAASIKRTCYTIISNSK